MSSIDIDVMQSQFTMFWNNSNVKGITLWGLRDRRHVASKHGADVEQRAAGPAMVWLMGFLGR